MGIGRSRRDPRDQAPLLPRRRSGLRRRSRGGARGHPRDPATPPPRRRPPQDAGYAGPGGGASPRPVTEGGAPGSFPPPPPPPAAACLHVLAEAVDPADPQARDVEAVALVVVMGEPFAQHLGGAVDILRVAWAVVGDEPVLP